MAEQPIIRGIQSVGAVSVYYQYNSADNTLPVPDGFKFGSVTAIDTTGAIPVAGFRLDGEFLNAAQQISSSNVIPILGGGGVALTNNNRTGTITFTCAKVSVPADTSGITSNLQMGPGSTSSSMGVVGGGDYYDMVLLAQLQQAAKGGDSVGSTIMISYLFNGTRTKIQFEGCTIANIAPIILTGNDAANYSIQVNYLNWKMSVGDDSDDLITD